VSDRTTDGRSSSRDALHTLCLADAVWAERYEGWTDLGRGGSATVVRTFSRDAGAEIAVKLFFGLTPDDRVRFQREVQNAQRLSAPEIVRTLSPFARGSLAWIEMELVEGGDLRSDLERREREGQPFTLEGAIEIAAAIARALVAAHQADVIHRDVKPANVLLPRSREPVAKLGDFGIARILGATRVTATGLLAGTPQFASPEVVAGREAGPPSDVYSLSLCLYLMLSGNRFPFEIADGSPPTRWMHAHADEKPRSIAELRPGLPQGLELLAMQGLSKDPDARPDAETMLAGLESLLGAPRARIRRVMRKSRTRMAGVVLALLCGVALGLVARGRLPRSVEALLGASTPEPPAAGEPMAAGPPGGPNGRAGAGAERMARPAAPTPTRPSPTPASAAPPRVTSPAPLRASLQGGLLTLLNAAPYALSELRLTLVGRGGERCEARVGALSPGEEILLSLDDFAPPPQAGFAASRLDVVFVDEAHVAQRASVPVTTSE
jgi:serine/threonine-protein kinase